MAPARSSAIVALLPAAAVACTYFEVEAPGDVWVAGRTMELGLSGGGMLGAAGEGMPELGPWQVALHPRGPDGEGVRNAYGYVAVQASTSQGPFVSDGMNEAGLSVSAHTMRMAKYQEPNPAKATLLFPQLVSWLLGQFDSVEAAHRGLANASVVTSPSYGREDYLHWSVADARGKSAVVEYVDGELQVHANDVRVMTNDPDYQWHLKNLNMYVGLTPKTPDANEGLAVETEIGTVPQIWSQGFSLLGMPGDLSPPSRFVRMFYLRRYAETNNPVKSVDDAMVLATGLLNNVFIPQGAAAPMQPAKTVGDYDFTNWALLKIPAQRRFLFRSYRSMVWKEVDLKMLTWDAAKSMPVSDGTLGIEQVTDKFRGPGAANVI